MKRKIMKLFLKDIALDPYTCQRDFDKNDLKELAESIKTHGMINPVLVRPLDNGKFELIHGEKRFKAAKQIRKKTILAEIRDVNDKEKLAIRLLESLRKDSIIPKRETNAYKQLVENFGYTPEQIAAWINKGHENVPEKLGLANSLSQTPYPNKNETKTDIEEETEILWFDPLELQVSKYNVRNENMDEDIDKLVRSVSQVGILEPLIITEDKQVICGQRRWMAAKELKEKYERDIKVPCILLKKGRKGYEALISLTENLRSKTITERDFGKQLLFLERSGWTLEEISRVTGESTSTLQMIKERFKPPSLLEQASQEQITQYMESKRKLSHRKRRIAKALQKAFPNDIVKQIEVANFVREAPVDVTSEMATEIRKRMPIDIKERMRRARENVPTVAHIVRIRKDVEKQLIKRLHREMGRDFQLVVERLLELWATYKLCQQCEELI